MPMNGPRLLACAPSGCSSSFRGRGLGLVTHALMSLGVVRGGSRMGTVAPGLGSPRVWLTPLRSPTRNGCFAHAISHSAAPLR
jgi:hypothetical protein